MAGPILQYMYQFLPLQGPHPQPLSSGEGRCNVLIYSNVKYVF